MRGSIIRCLFIITLLLLTFGSAAQDVPQIAPDAVWGNGNPFYVTWSSSGIAVGSSVGVWLYPADKPDDLPARVGTSDLESGSLTFNPAAPNQLAFRVRGNVEIWDVAEGAPGTLVQTLETDSRYLNELTYSQDGRILIANDGMRIYLWDTASGERLQVIENQYTTHPYTALSPDGSRLFTANLNGRALWDVASGELLRTDFPLSETIDTGYGPVAFSHDGQRVAVTLEFGHLAIFSLEDDTVLEYERPYRGDPATPGIMDVGFLPDGRLLTAETSVIGGLRLWETDGAITEAGELDLPDFASTWAFALSPDLESIVAINHYASHREVALVDLASLTQTTALRGFAPMGRLALSGDGAVLATPGPGSLLLLDAASGETMETLTYGARGLYGLALNQAGDQVAACVNDPGMDFQPFVALWTPAESSEAVLPTFDLQCWTVHYRDDTLLMVTERGVYRHEDNGEFTLLQPMDNHTWQTYAFGGNVLAANMSPDEVYLYDLADAPSEARPLDWQGEANSSSFGSLVRAVSPDGTRLAQRAGESSTLVDLYDIRPEAGSGGLLERTLESDTAVGFIAFSPDGTQVATGHHRDGSPTVIRLWDVESGALIAELVGGRGAVRGLVFSPDGQTLYSSGEDAVIRVWDVGAF